MPKFRQRLIVEAFQWWPPGSPLHDAVNTPVLAVDGQPQDPEHPVGLSPGTIFRHESKTGWYYVQSGLDPTSVQTIPLMPGQWIVPKVNQVWGNDPFELLYENVPDVPTPVTAEDQRREYVLLEKGLEEPAARMLRALYVTNSILPLHVGQVRDWLVKHKLIDAEAEPTKPMMAASTSPMSE